MSGPDVVDDFLQIARDETGADRATIRRIETKIRTLWGGERRHVERIETADRRHDREARPAANAASHCD